MKYIAIFLIRFYQLTLGRILPNSCRFMPSCSQYVLTALMIHGLLKGLILSIWRILRCQPFCRGGWDPVPPKDISLWDALKGKHLSKEYCRE